MNVENTMNLPSVTIRHAGSDDEPYVTLDITPVQAVLLMELLGDCGDIDELQGWDLWVAMRTAGVPCDTSVTNFNIARSTMGVNARLLRVADAWHTSLTEEEPA